MAPTKLIWIWSAIAFHIFMIYPRWFPGWEFLLSYAGLYAHHENYAEWVEGYNTHLKERQNNE